MTFTQKMDDWLLKWVPQEKPPRGTYLYKRLRSHSRARNVIYAVLQSIKPHWFDYEVAWERNKALVRRLLALPVGSRRPKTRTALGRMLHNLTSKQSRVRRLLQRKHPGWFWPQVNYLAQLLKLPSGAVRPKPKTPEYACWVATCRDTRSRR